MKEEIREIGHFKTPIGSEKEIHSVHVSALRIKLSVMRPSTQQDDFRDGVRREGHLQDDGRRLLPLLPRRQLHESLHVSFK